MNTILCDIKNKIVNVLNGYKNISLSVNDLEILFPENPDHGDLSINLAFQWAKYLKASPKIVANEIVSVLSKQDFINYFSKIEVAGPGFINFRYSDILINRITNTILTKKNSYGKNNYFENRSVLLEFVSANPTGPLTIAHARQAVVGDVLAKTFDFCGAKAVKEYYLNDKGVQISKLGESVFRRYLEILNVLPQDTFPEDCYQGDYIVDIAQELVKKYGDKYKALSIEDGCKELKDISYQTILKDIKKDLEEFRVVMDNFFSEKKLEAEGEIDVALKFLKEKGLTFENEGALWFASTRFGDDKDRVLIKSNGEHTYLTSDIPYHHHKLKRGFDILIDILGPDHHGYVSRLEAAVQAFGYSKEMLKVLIVQLTTLYRGTEQLRMSTRKGQFVSLRELINEVGVDASRYFFARRKTDTHLDFDLELAKKQSSDNPVFYVQYAYARINSIYKKALEKYPDLDISKINFDSDLIEESEKKMIKILIRFPEIVSEAASDLEPQKITKYLEEIAGIFQSYYSSGIRIVSDDFQLAGQKILVCLAFQQVIKNGLSLLGIHAPEKM